MLDVERISLELLAVHTGNCGFGLLFVRHLDETEPSRFACGAVSNNLDRCDIAERSEGFLHFVLGGVGGKIPDVDVH
ncbi:MAG TPA: hypothetical protein PKZ07_07510 [Sedimentisphaerales bacterium]|nr:hypothetical protein [Sedimentisphaerales bacterium]